MRWTFRRSKSVGKRARVTLSKIGASFSAASGRSPMKQIRVPSEIVAEIEAAERRMVEGRRRLDAMRGDGSLYALPFDEFTRVLDEQLERNADLQRAVQAAAAAAQGVEGADADD